MKNFKQLLVWQKSIDLVEVIYKLTSDFPNEEKFGLISQIRRCGVSIPSNIAEGSARGEKEFMHFLNISKGSAFELETQIIIASKLEFISNKPFEEVNLRIIEIQKMISGLQKSLKA